MTDHERIVFLQGKRLYLRPLEEHDLDRCRRWVNDPEVRKFLARIFPLDDVAEQQWYSGRDRTVFPRDLGFAIVLREGDAHIGNMGLHGIDWVNRFATTGTVIGEPEHWGKGYAHEAKTLLLEYVFNTLGLRRVQSTVLAPNERSLKALYKSGYVHEGVHKAKFLRNGELIDEISLAVMAEDWRALHAKSSAP